MADRKKVYIAGPMRGRPGLNWAAFDEAERRWREAGWEVINPAQIDRQAGISPDQPFSQADVDDRFRTDLLQIAISDAIAVLPGWQGSTLAPVEVAAARGCGMPVYDAMSNPAAPVEVERRESILSEADRLTARDRNADYGHPSEDFARAAALINTVLGTALEPRDIGLLMICVKLAREAHKPKRDNLVDIAGYARTIDMIDERGATDAALHL